MNTDATLKELLKPPFKFICNAGDYKIIDSERKRVLEIGRHAFLKTVDDMEGYKKQADFIDFVASVLNEKCEQIFQELMRWKLVDEKIACYACPKCEHIYPQPDNKHKGFDNFCPNCGQRLFPPNYLISETIDGVQTGLIIPEENIEE